MSDCSSSVVLNFRMMRASRGSKSFKVLMRESTMSSARFVDIVGDTVELTRCCKQFQVQCWYLFSWSQSRITSTGAPTILRRYHLLSEIVERFGTIWKLSIVSRFSVHLYSLNCSLVRSSVNHWNVFVSIILSYGAVLCSMCERACAFSSLWTQRNRWCNHIARFPYLFYSVNSKRFVFHWLCSTLGSTRHELCVLLDTLTDSLILLFLFREASV